MSEFLVELSVALHKHAMYPSGHPSLEPAAARVVERAERLLQDRPTIAFGVARAQLIIDGVATDPRHPVLRRLAEELHRHHLGAISILPGIEADEVGGALRALAEETDSGVPLGLAPAGQAPDWPHIRLHPLTFDRLELVDDEASNRSDGDASASSRAAQLWVGLASAAMASDHLPVAEAPTVEPTAVARAIDEHSGADAYDQVIVGYLLQIAEELKGAPGGASGLRRRTARLIAALQPETLRRLVMMGGNAAQRRAFVLGATSGMAVESVIKILEAAAQASGETISHGLIRMLSKLAAHAQRGREHARPLADGALREQVDRLLSGWVLDDPNPEGYGKVLQHLSSGESGDRGRAEAARAARPAEPLRILQMGLEADACGPLLDRAVDRIIAGGDVRAVRQLVSEAPHSGGAAVDAVKSKLTDPRTIALLVTREPPDMDSLDDLLPSISIDGYDVLLDALTTSDSRTTRRKLLDRIGQADLDIAPLIVARLDDGRWYVQRNMLLLLERLGRVPEGFSAVPWTGHPDPRVRYQALRLELTLPADHEPVLRAALEDPDDRIVRLGLLALQDGCPGTLVPLVARAATDPRMLEELRVHAVRALGTSRERVALDTLMHLVDGGRTILGRPRLAPSTPVVVAAVRALAETWPTNTRTREVLGLALASSNPDIRHAVQAGHP